MIVYTSEEKDIIIEKLKSSLVESTRRRFIDAMPEVIPDEIQDQLMAESMSNLNNELERQILEIRNQN